jgi:deazaflavin-dependent oxidoreductase (nitroreductase family)
MPLEGEYEPSPWDFVADQVRLYEATGGKEGGTNQGKPVVILTTRGRRSGRIRKVPLQRVEHDGRYVVVASKGGTPEQPEWYLNLVEHPEVTLQDGERVMDLRARTATPEERTEWWTRATAAWPDYDEYQTHTDRQIPVVILEPVG